MAEKKSGVPITLEHGAILSALWKPLCIEHEIHFAEYSFAHVFLFRRKQSYTFIELEIPLVKGMHGEFDQGGHYLIPTCVPGKMELEASRAFPMITPLFFLSRLSG